MEPKKIKKLSLTKETISQLDQIRGGRCAMSTTCGNTDVSLSCVTCGTCAGGGCDFDTIGHDDGPNCLSATDWGWCWCYGR